MSTDEQRRQQALTALEASRVLRVRRAELHRRVAAGERLSRLIREHGTVLYGCQLDRLVRWLPGVGDQRAIILLRGLPAHSLLSDLDADERALLLFRIARYEHHHAITKEEDS